MAHPTSDRERKNAENDRLLKEAGRDFGTYLAAELVIHIIFRFVWNALMFFPRLLLRFWSNMP